MQFVRKACDNKGCKCLSWPCSPIVTLALRFDLQCKEYKHDGTQTTFRHCKSWKAVEIDCHSFYHSLIFETMCLTVFQTTIACQNDPKWSTTMTKAKTQAQPRKQNSSLQFSSTKVTTSAIGVSRPCIQNQYFNSTKSPLRPRSPLAPWPALGRIFTEMFHVSMIFHNNSFRNFLRSLLWGVV